MPTFVIPSQFTDQGIRGAAESPKRADAFKAMAKKAGANLREFLWTLGSYDMVAMIEAPDAETVTTIALSIAKLGNVRTQVLREFNKSEMNEILKKEV